MPRFTRILFHLTALCDSLRCGAYGTYCYGISLNVVKICYLLKPCSQHAVVTAAPPPAALAPPPLSQHYHTGPVCRPELWGREEALIRTGCYSAFHESPWQPTALGGSDILRATRLYGADYQQEAAAECEGCSKPGSQHAALLPGCLFYYCLCCRRCIGFHVMDNAESPKMPFVFFYTR